MLVFQAVRELLMNVVKDAQASKAVVELRAQVGRLVITVCDDGKGIESTVIGRVPTAFGGFGLFSLNERLRPMCGEIEIRSDGGTTVVLQTPLVTDP